MPVIHLGNTAPIEPVKVDESSTTVERVPRPELGNQITTFDVPNDLGAGEVLTLVSKVFQSHHSDEKPAWIESDNAAIRDALASEFGCPTERPADWDATEPVEAPAETQTITPADVATVPAAVTEPAEAPAPAEAAPAPVEAPAPPTPEVTQ
jgi:hypothetical protein